MNPASNGPSDITSSGSGEKCLTFPVRMKKQIPILREPPVRIFRLTTLSSIHKPGYLEKRVKRRCPLAFDIDKKPGTGRCEKIDFRIFGGWPGLLMGLWYVIDAEGAPSLRFLQGRVAMLPT